MAQTYIYEKEQNKVWQREYSHAYTVSLGKLIGACMALNYELDETVEGLTIKSGKKIVIKI